MELDHDTRPSNGYSVPISTHLGATVLGVSIFFMGHGGPAAQAGECVDGLGFPTFWAFPVGDSPLSVVAEDLNCDGSIDLAAANSNSGDVSVVMGNGDGTFQAEWRISIGEDPSSLVAVDLNGDGWMDLATAGGGAGPGSESFLAVFLGNGDGTFQQKRHLGVGVMLNALVTGDFNGDGRLDLATANFGADHVSILIGNGDGTFQEERRFGTGLYPSSIVASDFNGDGKLDLATGNCDLVESPMGIWVLLGNGDGTFGEGERVVAGPISSLAAGGLNGDEKTDLAAGFDEVAEVGCFVQLCLGGGDGTFPERRFLDLGREWETPYSLVTKDLNGDGRLDLVTGSYVSGLWHTFLWLPGGVTVFLQDRNGRFGEGHCIGVGIFPHSIVAADFDGDGFLDLATANSGSNSVSVLLGRGDGMTFDEDSSLDVGAGPISIVAADFNRDGGLDLATANYGSHDVSVLLGSGNGTFQAERRFGGVPDAGSIVTADVNGDGRLDLVAANALTDDVSVLLNECAQSGGLQRPGDANQDGGLDLSDAVWLLGHLFLGEHRSLPCEGRSAGNPGPGELTLLDGNGDGRLDLSDAIHILAYLFVGGEPPVLGAECVAIAGCPDRCQVR